jgi:hypothetical protein
MRTRLPKSNALPWTSSVIGRRCAGQTWSELKSWETIMNHFFATLICLTLGTTIFALSNDQTQFVALEDHVANSQCSSKCQGDFPTSSNRKYAGALEAHDWA